MKRRLTAAEAARRLARAPKSAQRDAAIRKTVRIGITRDAHRLLRFYERGNPHVSGPKNLLR